MSILLLLGATGETGRHALTSALSSPTFTSIHSLGRRASPLLPSPPPPHLTQTTVDFDSLLSGTRTETDKFAVGAGAVVIALGTTRAAAGGMEGFVRIDREYVVASAKAAKREGKQRLVYCSSAGANSASWFPYTKSKGLTEEALAEVGYDETIIFRPGMLYVPGGRTERRLPEAIAQKVINAVSPFLPISIEIHTPVLGAALIKAAELGVEGMEKVGGVGKWEELKGRKVWVVGNREAVKLGKL